MCVCMCGCVCVCFCLFVCRDALRNQEVLLRFVVLTALRDRVTALQMAFFRTLGAGHCLRICRVSHLPSNHYPKSPCTQIVYTLAPKYLYKDYFKAKVYTIWVHGPVGL